MNRKTLIISLMGCFLFLGSSFAQQTKLDSILVKQNQLLDGQQSIRNEVTYQNPLAGKNFGVEFNPAYFLIASAADQLVLSGGVSLFNVNPQAELSFPVYYRSEDRDGYTSGLFTLDAHYRYFLGKHRKGFYLSSGVRFAHINGLDDRWEEQPNQYGREISHNKFGLMFGLGYRIFSRSGFYWGTSLSVGRYFSDQSAHLDDAGLDATKLLLDVELLKFGYAF